MINRGGQILSTGKIGFMKPIRQQMMLPGETIKARLRGNVQMNSLRERDALRINAHISAFLTPIRWLDPNWADYVTSGPQGNVTLQMMRLQPNHYGLGGNQARDIQQFWHEAVLRVYNQWYKWPEADDFTLPLGQDGIAAVNLEHSWTRCRWQQEPEHREDQYLEPLNNMLDVTALAEVQARFRSAVQREILSYERYMEVLREAWGADGSREVDQVPILIAQDDVGVMPRSYPATDAAGLGQWAALYDFDVDWMFTVSAPEHCILTYVLTCRFAPITEEIHPLADTNLSWAEQVGDPSILAATQPQPVMSNQVFDVPVGSTAFSLGYLPAGWQWRAQNNIVGTRVDVRDSFPVMEVPTNMRSAKDATRRVDAFREEAFGDFRIDLYAEEMSHSAIPNALSSYYLGVGDAGKGDSSPYPKQGKLK